MISTRRNRGYFELLLHPFTENTVLLKQLLNSHRGLQLSPVLHLHFLRLAFGREMHDARNITLS